MTEHEEKYLHVKKKSFYYGLGALIATYFLFCVNYKLMSSLENLTLFSDFALFSDFIFIDIGCVIFIIFSTLAYILLVAVFAFELGE